MNGDNSSDSGLPSADVPALFAALADAALLLDRNGRVVHFNDAAAEMLGTAVGLAAGRPIEAVLPDLGTTPVMQRLAAGDGVQVAVNGVNGSPRDLVLKVRPLEVGREMVGAVAVVQDVTPWRLRERRLRRLAEQDPLTGLANRAAFLARLEAALPGRAGREVHGAVLYLDFDHFKPINDRFGHAAGDQVLRDAGRRLSEAVRGSDMVARLGGDEFGIHLEGISCARAAAKVARKVVRRLSAPFRTDGAVARIGVSIGITLYPRDGRSPEVLLHNADGAMYQAKERGTGFVFFQPPAARVE